MGLICLIFVFTGWTETGCDLWWDLGDYFTFLLSFLLNQGGSALGWLLLEQNGLYVLPQAGVTSLIFMFHLDFREEGEFSWRSTRSTNLQITNLEKHAIINLLLQRRQTSPTVLVSRQEHNTGEKKTPSVRIFLLILRWGEKKHLLWGFLSSFAIRSVADDVAAAIVSHWNGDYLYESENRSRGQL